MNSRKYVYLVNLVKTMNPKHERSVDKYFHVSRAAWEYVFDDYRRKDQFVKVIYKENPSKNNHFAMSMRLSEFIFNMILWRLHFSFKEMILEEDFHDVSNMSGDKMKNIMEGLIKKFVEKGHDIDQISYQASIMIDELSYLAEAYSSIAANTFSLWDIGQFEDRDETFKMLINTRIDERLPVKEMEKFLKHSETTLFDCIKKDASSCLYPYIMSGRLDKTQMVQMFVAVGPRADIDKSILPRIIKGNYLHGLKDAGEYYVEAVTARVALLTKHSNISLSGYLSRKINILSLSSAIDWDVEDCGTPNFLTYTVESKDHLKFIVGKNMKTERGDLHVVTMNDVDLIGKTVLLRSHICCALHGQNRVCKTCYGPRHKTLKGTRIGGLPAVKWINPMSDRSMSAKHKMITNAADITNPTIVSFFEEHGSFLYLKPEYFKSNDCSILVDRECIDDLMNSEIDTEDDTVDISIPLENIRIKIGDEEFPIENEGVSLSFTEDVLNKEVQYLDENTDSYVFPVKKLDETAPIFSIILFTEEISRYLSMIMSKIEGSSTKKYVHYNDLIRDIIRIIIDSGMFVSINHLETFVYQMVRNPEDVTVRPDFSVYEPNQAILSITRATMKKDMNTSTVFQGLREQFRDVNTYFKSGTSIFDPFFRSTPMSFDVKVSQ